MLKKYASILRGIGIVTAALSLIGGIIVAVNTESFLYFIYCAIGAGLTCFFSFALAELLDTTEDNNAMLKQLTRNAASNNSSAPQQAAAAQSYPVKATAHVSANAGKPKRKSPYADPNNACILICPNCKARQSSENIFCYQCHTPLYEVPAQEKSETDLADFTFDPNNAENIICGKCGTAQRSNRNVCLECGAKFRK